MTPRKPQIVNAGTDAISFEGMLPSDGGSGLVVHDERASGRWARITAQPDPQTNAYGFAACDDFRPATFPTAHQQEDGSSQLASGPFRGNGVQTAAYEVTGNTAVPADGSAVVWLEPLRARPGYGFTYSAAAGDIPAARTSLGASSQFDLAYPSSVWQDVPVPAGIGSQGLERLTLPGDGTYLVYGFVKVSGQPRNTTGGVITALVGARMYDDTLGVAVQGTTRFAIENIPPALPGPLPYVIDVVTCVQFATEYVIGGGVPHVLRWQGFATWPAGSTVPPTLGGTFDTADITGSMIAYVKLDRAPGGSGPPGPAGATGATGATGPAGADGADGATVPDASNSVIGMQVFGQ